MKRLGNRAAMKLIVALFVAGSLAACATTGDESASSYTPIHTYAGTGRCARVEQGIGGLRIAISKARGDIEVPGEYWVGVFDTSTRRGAYSTVRTGAKAECLKAFNASAAQASGTYVLSDPSAYWEAHVLGSNRAVNLLEYGWLHEAVPMDNGDVLALRLVEPVKVSDGSVDTAGLAQIIRNDSPRKRLQYKQSGDGQPGLLSDVGEARAISMFLSRGTSQEDISARRQEVQIRLASWERNINTPLRAGVTVCSFSTNEYGRVESAGDDLVVQVRGTIPGAVTSSAGTIDVGPGVFYSRISAQLPVILTPRRAETTADYFRACSFSGGRGR